MKEGPEYEILKRPRCKSEGVKRFNRMADKWNNPVTEEDLNSLFPMKIRKEKSEEIK